MSAQRKVYLQLADRSTGPRSKIFYRLMAEVAPALSDAFRKNINQVGPSVIYDITLRVAASLVIEVSANLGNGVVDIERASADLKIALQGAADKMETIGAVSCTPHLDS